LKEVLADWITLLRFGVLVATDDLFLFILPLLNFISEYFPQLFNLLHARIINFIDFVSLFIKGCFVELLLWVEIYYLLAQRGLQGLFAVRLVDLFKDDWTLLVGLVDPLRRIAIDLINQRFISFAFLY
jgi:hypothetical protein